MGALSGRLTGSIDFVRAAGFIIWLGAATALSAQAAEKASVRQEPVAQEAEKKKEPPSKKKPPGKSKPAASTNFSKIKAFRNAPPPNFDVLRVKLTSSDDGHQEKTEYKLQKSDGVVTIVSETSESVFKDLDGSDWRQKISSNSRYVLGGLLFVGGDWRGIREERGGAREQIREGAETSGFKKIKGRLFPLAVGNKLSLSYQSRIKTSRTSADNKASFQVVKEIEAKSYDSRLDGKLFVIRVEYSETYGDEASVVREDIYYSPAFGWPVGYDRSGEEGGIEQKSRLVEFAKRK